MLSITWIGWTPFITSILAGLLVAYYWIWSRSRFVRLINAVPGPDCLPILGNILALNVPNDEIMDIVSGDWVKKYGSIYRVWFGLRPVILLTAPELLEPILGTYKFIMKPGEYDIFTPFIGKGIPAAADERWKKNRRLLNPAFHFQILNTMFDAINEKSADCVREFEEALEINKGQEIDVFPIMSRSTLDIICDTFMGRKTLKSEEKSLFLDNLAGFERIFQQRIIKPWLRINWFFKLTAFGRENARYVKSLHEFCNTLITDRRELLKREKVITEKHSELSDKIRREAKNNVDNDNDRVKDQDDEPKKKMPFLDMVIEDLGKGHFSDNDIKDESQTTSLAFTWFLCMIAKNPYHQKLLLEEVDVVFGDSDRPCTTQDLTELKYLECCIKETMRLYPSIPFVLRCLTEDCEIGSFVL
uniref:Cytochrome P450 n=1 Tax=Daphnia galeata TaxID=27404 RepID=A0A8J2RWD1_9CRUS|nr:unnamed protein product [Daphnia galeata]